MVNLFDKAIEHIAPCTAAKRIKARKFIEIMNSGYSEGGASTRKNSFKGWNWRGGSTREDIELNLSVLRQRSLNLYMTSGIARAGINRIDLNSIGMGLRLRSIPDAEVLGISQDEATAWAREREREFAIFADSRECDQLGLNTFDESQSQTLVSWLTCGDAFVMLPMDEPTPTQPYSLRFHLIEAARVQNPGSMGDCNTPLDTTKYHNGVEVDQSGRVVAYHIRSNHPLAQYQMKTDWVRVPVRGEQTGKLNVIHLMVSERAEQYRGVPILAPVIEACKQLARYTEYELMAAVVAAMYTVFIKTKTPETPFGQTEPTAETAQVEDDFNYSLGPGAIVSLADGEEISEANPTRPNAQFEAFVNAVSGEIGAALNIPVELLMLKFQGSYSAARAALLEAWKIFRIWRKRMATGYCQPIFEEWLTESILIGRTSAPGFFDDIRIRKAWSRAQWNGPGPGQVQPVQEVKAAQMRVDYGFSTFAQEAQEISGNNFDEIVQEQDSERKRLANAGITLNQKQAQPADANNDSGGKSKNG